MTLSTSPPEDTLPARGWLDRCAHVFPVRVYFEDTDAAGIVYHAVHLNYAERARTELMRLLGASHSDMMAETGAVFVVRRAEIDYRYPALLDDALWVQTTARDFQRASLVVEQRILLHERVARAAHRAANPATGPQTGTELARIVVKLACINGAGRPVRIPDRVRSALDSVAGTQ